MVLQSDTFTAIIADDRPLDRSLIANWIKLLAAYCKIEFLDAPEFIDLILRISNTLMLYHAKNFGVDYIIHLENYNIDLNLRQIYQLITQVTKYKEYYYKMITKKPRRKRPNSKYLSKTKEMSPLE